MAARIPDGFTAVTPYLVIADVDQEMAFVTQALGATEMMTHRNDAGLALHTQMVIDGAVVMMGRAGDVHGALPAMVYVYVPDADAAFARAAAFSGATVTMPLADQWYGDRSGTVRTTNGVEWCIAASLKPEHQV